MGQINVAIIGVGNCASSLVQGIHKYSEVQDNELQVPGLMHNVLGGYSIGDVVTFERNNTQRFGRVKGFKLPQKTAWQGPTGLLHGKVSSIIVNMWSQEPFYSCDVATETIDVSPTDLRRSNENAYMRSKLPKMERIKSPADLNSEVEGYTGTITPVLIISVELSILSNSGCTIVYPLLNSTFPKTASTSPFSNLSDIQETPLNHMQLIVPVPSNIVTSNKLLLKVFFKLKFITFPIITACSDTLRSLISLTFVLSRYRLG